MAYNSQFSPLEYLERRIKYYKKRTSVIKSNLNKEWLIKRYGRWVLKKATANALENNANRIAEFKMAAEILRKSPIYNKNKIA